MKGKKWENFKSLTIAVLFGMLAMMGITWRSTGCMIGGGYLVAQVVWVFMTCYDEIQRKREESRKHEKL